MIFEPTVKEEFVIVVMVLGAEVELLVTGNWELVEMLIGAEEGKL